MFENYGEKKEDNPFNIVHNYRAASTRSSKLSKRHRIRKMSEVRLDIPAKKPRKMTEHIEVERIL